MLPIGSLALPEVVDSARVTGLGLVALGSPSAMSLPAPGQQLLVSDERFGTDVNSFVLLDGAAARPDRLEAVVSELNPASAPETTT